MGHHAFTGPRSFPGKPPKPSPPKKTNAAGASSSSDEAHLLDAEQLEGLRLLTNVDIDNRSPFACLLIGQPTLRRRIRLDAFAALDQRMALRYSMTGTDPAETASYVAHHPKIAGRSDTLFSDDALALVHQVSRGLPRAVNNLAVQSLVAAFTDNKAIVDESSAEQQSPK